jgi:hypothetical protein
MSAGARAIEDWGVNRGDGAPRLSGSLSNQEF